jgi:hypothetical protein
MQIVFFPYMNLNKREEIDFGFLKIWNFNLKGENYITDAKLLSKVTKVLATNQEYFNGPIREIGIVSIGDTDFREYNETEFNLIKEARLILFISFLSKNNALKSGLNYGFWCATTENFNPAFQRFNLDDDNMAIFDGYIIPIIAGGYIIGEQIFYKPNCILSLNNFDIDNELFDMLLVLRKKKPRVFNKIIRAVEIFSESYYNSLLLSTNARILCQMSAFEMLLNIPDKNQRRYFKDIVEAEMSTTTEKRYVYYYEVRNRKVRERRPLKVIWADRFYTLRNHIIHGLTVKSDEYIFKKSQRHFDIALIMFVFFIKAQINKSMKKRIFNQSINWEEEIDPRNNSNKAKFRFKYYPF